MSKFKQHILNYKSIVGGTTTARDDLVYHFPLDEGKKCYNYKRYFVNKES